jgi:tetratricopeptide (TPR) repeat protein
VRLSTTLLLVSLLAGVAATAVESQAPAGAQPSADALARAAELIDAGQPAAAVALLDARLASREEPPALLLRSTARFLLGEMDSGEADLRRALALDPALRQGWLNLAALEMAGGDHEAARQAFLRAEALDPGALDNDVNLGAVLLFLGRLEEASGRFERYLAREAGSGQAYYLVATNYAAAGYAALALRHLADAIRIDEKMRLGARTDANFAQIASSPEYARLLATDAFVHPPGSLLARRAFAAPYSDGDTRVVSAVLDALRALRVPFDRRVEVTPEWALIWADVRIKVRRDGAERTVVEVSAPPAAFTPQAFQARVEALFRQTEALVLRYRTAGEKLGLPPESP